MARVTVEDCEEKVPNRFELVMLAAQRARHISAGAAETVKRDNDKNPVVALREIAEETVVLDELRESLIQGLQKHLPFDDFEEEEPPMTVIGDVGMVGMTMGEAAPAADDDDDFDDADGDEGADGDDDIAAEAKGDELD